MNIYIRTNENDLLKYLNQDELLNIQKLEKMTDFQPSQMINEDQDYKENIYVIKTGSVKITYNTGKKSRTIDECHDGEIIWLTNLFNDHDLSITINALIPTSCHKYNLQELSQFMLNNPSIASKIQAALNDSQCEKLIRITQKLGGR